MLGTVPTTTDIQASCRSLWNSAVGQRDELALASLIPTQVGEKAAQSFAWAVGEHLPCPDAAALSSAILVATRLGEPLTLRSEDLNSGPAVHLAASAMWGQIPHLLSIESQVASLIEQLIPASTVLELLSEAIKDGMPLNDTLREYLGGDDFRRDKVIEDCLCYALGEYEKETTMFVGSSVLVTLPFLGVDFYDIEDRSEFVQGRVRQACEALSRVVPVIATPQDLIDLCDFYFEEVLTEFEYAEIRAKELGADMTSESSIMKTLEDHRLDFPYYFEEREAIRANLDDIAAFWRGTYVLEDSEPNADEESIVAICNRIQEHVTECQRLRSSFADPESLAPLIPLLFPENKHEIFSPQGHFEAYSSECEETFKVSATESLVPLYWHLKAFAQALDLLIELSEACRNEN